MTDEHYNHDVLAGSVAITLALREGELTAEEGIALARKRIGKLWGEAVLEELRVLCRTGDDPDEYDEDFGADREFFHVLYVFKVE